MEYHIRVANESDAKAVHDIYGAYVPLDYVTFTIDNPSVESYREKIIHTLEKYPFLIAEGEDKTVLGYVYGVIVDNNEPSLAFHKSLGFVEVGRFKNAGYKMDAWRGIRWLVKEIGKSGAAPKEPIPFQNHFFEQ